MEQETIRGYQPVSESDWHTIVPMPRGYEPPMDSHP